MKIGRVVMALAVLCFVVVARTPSQSKSIGEVTALLREFLEAAGRSDRVIFDKFFADDVIYTRATGAVITKADIMESLGKSAPASEGKAAYSAEDIAVHEYGNTLIVAFRLVGNTTHVDGKVETVQYRNTGTFLRRNGR